MAFDLALRRFDSWSEIGDLENGVFLDVRMGRNEAAKGRTWVKPSMVWMALLGIMLIESSSARGAVYVYDVSAWIDTNDYLYVHGSTLQWEHNAGGSPAGTHGGPNPTIISSMLDSVPKIVDLDWNQTWPSPLPDDAFSSIFTPLDPALPLSGSFSASVSTIAGRGTPTIFQQPTPANNETLIVKFADGFGGAQYLDAQITVVVPEPASLGLLGLSMMALRRTRPRSCR